MYRTAIFVVFFVPLERCKMEEFEAEDGAILGCLVLEPIVMGAGGMIFVDPLFQRMLVQARYQYRSSAPI